MGNYLYTLDNKILQHKGLTVDLVGEIIQRPQVCIYGNGTNFIRSDNDFNFGAATNKSYTIAGWCQSTHLGGVAPNLYTEFFVMLGTATWRSFFRFYETISTTQSHYHFNVATGKYFYINYPTSGNNFAKDTWYFTSVTFDDTANTVAMYVYDTNGTLTMSGGSTSWTATPYKETNITLRLPYNPTYKQKYNATGVWNRALTLSELQGLMNNGKGKSYVHLSAEEKTNLLAWWDCDTYTSANGLMIDKHSGGKNLTATTAANASLVAI